MAASFKNISAASFNPQLGPKSTSDSLHWTSFNFPKTVKEYGPVMCIDFDPSDSRSFAVSTSTKVQIYDTVTSQVSRTLSKSHEAVYGGNFRKDGKLLVAGGEEGKIRVFDITNKSLLRVFRGHTAAVHACKFTLDNVHVISFSNDKNVILWDVPGETTVRTFQEHKDYVHTGAVSKSSNNIFISGSYDHTVKLFDTRSPASVMTVNHGAPVESVIMFPSGGVFISSGGTDIKIWDAIGGGRLISKLSQHHKTITCLTFASQGQRILSGSLDRHVKIYDVKNYHVVHTMDFSSPILSVGIADDDSTLAVGMSDGLLSIQNHTQSSASKPGDDTVTHEHKLKHSSLENAWRTTFVKNEKIKKPTPYDRYLKQFETSRALDHVLRHHVNKDPHIAMAVIRELVRRGSIKAAIAGKTDDELLVLLTFILKHIANPVFCQLMIDFGNIVLDLYGTKILQSPRLTILFKKVHRRINQEIECMKEMMALNGTIELLLAASNAGRLGDVMNEELPITHSNSSETGMS